MTPAKISKYVLNNYRMASYLLLAIGLINLRYQTGKDEVFNNSLTIIIPGIAMLLITFLKGITQPAGPPRSYGSACSCRFSASDLGNYQLTNR
jgi:hypothetical protein